MSRLCAILLAVLLAPGPVMPGEQDIFDRAVPVDTGRPTFVLYANHETEDAVSEPLSYFAATLFDVQPLVIVRVDLRGLPGFLHGIADDNMRDHFRNGLRDYAVDTQLAGQNPPPHPENNLFFIADKDGHWAQAAGLPKGFPEAVGVAYDAQGRVLLQAAFPRQAPELAQALRGSVGRWAE